MSSQPIVLIVDDDLDIRLGATLRLRAAGFTTLDAGDGDQCVARAVQHRPDVIVLDIRMPKRDGLSALAELQDRDDTCNIPVVMLSASVVDQQVALDSGARFFLKKPYQGRELVAAVQVALNNTTRTSAPGIRVAERVGAAIPRHNNQMRQP